LVVEKSTNDDDALPVLTVSRIRTRMALIVAALALLAQPASISSRIRTRKALIVAVLALMLAQPASTASRIQDEEGVDCAGPCAEDDTGYCGDVIVNPGVKIVMSATTTPVVCATTIFRM
jgi:hypothetical protein